MSKSNDVTGDRITNALKGDKEKYRTGWEAIFGDKDMKKHVEQITGDVPHNVLNDLERVSKEMDKRNVYTDYEEQYKILDEITRLDQEMWMYDD